MSLICISWDRGFPGGLVGKKSACRRSWLNPWVRKIPWRKAWQPILVFLPVKSHGQRRLAVCSPWGRKDLDITEAIEQHTHTHITEATEQHTHTHTHTHNNWSDWATHTHTCTHTLNSGSSESVRVHYYHTKSEGRQKPLNWIYSVKQFWYKWFATSNYCTHKRNEGTYGDFPGSYV